MSSPAKLKAGSTIGIFGGGQLGRMLSSAAQRLGFHVLIYDPKHDTPAGRISTAATAAPYEEMAAVSRFAKACDVITYEFENIPVDTVLAAGQFAPVYPAVNALRTAQDRIIEKTYLSEQAGAPVIGFRQVDTLDDLKAAVKELGLPAILKTRRFGYDGKGQTKIDAVSQIPATFKDLGGKGLILEAFAPFIREVSVVAARGRGGKIKCYPIAENVHKNHILHTSTVPANVSAQTETHAQSITKRILETLEYVGVLAVEFFELEDGELIVNEIAPRVHNSGHWSMDGGCCDQFEQHIRAIAGLPLGKTVPAHGVKMTNLIGADIRQAKTLSRQAGIFVHDYDKRDIRAGRKMGHYNQILKPSAQK